LAAARFAPLTNACVRALQDSDRAAFEEFRAAGESSWSDSGLDEAVQWRQAYFEDGQITALAGYRAWSDAAGDPCVLTRREFRRGGRAKAVVSAVVATALARGKLVLYQTLESNVASVRTAFSLGYDRYATHLAVRLAAGE
jgi:predicted GNAT family acetyltransferase